MQKKRNKESASDSFFVATNLKVCPNDSSESSSFFTFSSNNKLLGFNINDEISLSLPGFTSAIYGVKIIEQKGFVSLYVMLGNCC